MLSCSGYVELVCDTSNVDNRCQMFSTFNGKIKSLHSGLRRVQAAEDRLSISLEEFCLWFLFSTITSGESSFEG